MIQLRNINLLFILSFRISRNFPAINCFDRHYMLLAEIKDCKVVIDNKSFFEQTIKTNQECMKD